ncbi:MAG: membrane dipeptidase [Clostridia bacterium]|nr:membrane dipeptidase [Clostridia bacterium]
MRLFDLHCDTPTKLFDTGSHISDNSLHVSLKRASAFEKYIQCAAVWCPESIDDASLLQYFLNVSSYFKDQVGSFIISREQLSATTFPASFILTVEDSRLVSHDPDKIKLLFRSGVRVMTLLWGGVSSVGGAWNTSEGLSPKGRQILEACFDTGIIPDISHASTASADYILKRSVERGRPVIATHSDSYTVCNHKRNLSDLAARLTAQSGGIIGISLSPPHLNGEKADLSHILNHISHFINIIGTESLCLGCDFDGISSTPDGIEGIDSLTGLYAAVSARFGSTTADRVFFENAYNFFLNNLP